MSQLRRPACLPVVSPQLEVLVVPVAMAESSKPSTFSPTTPKSTVNVGRSLNTRPFLMQRGRALDNARGRVNNSNEKEFVPCTHLLIKDQLHTVQDFNSEETNCGKFLLNLSFQHTSKQLNITQQLLLSSDTSLWIASSTHLSHSEKQMKAVQRLLQMFSRVKSNSGKFTDSIKTLSNVTSSPDHVGCKECLSLTHILTLTDNATPVSTHCINGICLRTEPEGSALFQYLDLAIYLTISIVGLIGNGILAFMFVRYSEIRTRSNVMIMNLVVCDVVNLTLSVPLHYFFPNECSFRHSVTLCRAVLSARLFLRSMNAYAVVAVSIQRCSSMTSRLRSYRSLPEHKRRMLTSTVLCILSVWLLPLTIAMPGAFVKSFYNWHCSEIGDEQFVKMMALVSALLYCVILPSVMFVCSMMTAQRLQHSARNIPGDTRNIKQEQQRNRSAAVMVALALVFVFSYFPFHVMILLMRWDFVCRTSALVHHSLRMSKHLLFANGCFNPIALFGVSRNFRKLLIKLVRFSARRDVDISRFKQVSVYAILTENELKCVKLGGKKNILDKWELSHVALKRRSLMESCVYVRDGFSRNLM